MPWWHYRATKDSATPHWKRWLAESPSLGSVVVRSTRWWLMAKPGCFVASTIWMHWGKFAGALLAMPPWHAPSGRPDARGRQPHFPRSARSTTIWTFTDRYEIVLHVPGASFFLTQPSTEREKPYS